MFSRTFLRIFLSRGRRLAVVLSRNFFAVLLLRILLKIEHVYNVYIYVGISSAET